jgi:8-oxo-dGTP pyrophosphatase MutT (NUDIX family)
VLRVREAARVVALDGDGRVLLLQCDEDEGVYWATPGGGVEPGEDFAAAARRELLEELGVREIELGPVVAWSVSDLVIGGEVVRQREEYFLARLAADAVVEEEATQPDASMIGWRWWSVADLRVCVEPVYPDGLADLISLCVREGGPGEPVDLAGWPPAAGR